MINEMLPSKASNLADVRCFTEGQTETKLQKLMNAYNLAIGLELRQILTINDKDLMSIAIQNLITKVESE